MRKFFAYGLVCLASLILTSIPASSRSLPSSSRPQFNTQTAPGAYTIAMTTQYIEQEMARHNVTGLSIALVNNNGIIWEKGFGWADKENQVPAGPESVYMIGSISKFFTAVVLARLQEQGMLNIDNPVSFYLPEFQMQDRYPGTFDQITVRSLLTHQSGIPGDLFNAGFTFGKGWDTWGGCAQYMSWLIDYLKEDYPTLPPGKHIVYTNTGFVLAGEIALRTGGLIGENFPDFMDRMILSPLGMTSSSLHTVESNLARGYVCGATPETCEKQPVKETNCTFGATGGIYSSVRDMAAFMTTLLNQGTGADGTRYLKPETIAMLGESESSNLDVDSFFITGLGLDTVKDPGLTYAGRAWGKTGGTGDYVSYMLLLPDVNLGVVVLTNSNTGGNLTFGASRTCLENALFESYGMLPSPPFLPDYPSVSDPGAIAGIYVKKNGFDRVQDKGDGTFNWIVNAHSEAPLTYTLTYDFDKKAFLSSRGNEFISFTNLSHEGEDHFVMIQSGSSGSSQDTHQYWGNVQTLFGEKLTPQSIPDVWKNRMGLYFIDNLPWNDVAWESPFALLSEEEGLMVMNFANTLVPETESLAYVAGLNNRADSSVRAIIHDGKEKLMYGGYRLISPADIQAVTWGETLSGTVDLFKNDWYRFDSPGPGQYISVTVSDGDGYYLTLVDMTTEQMIRDTGSLSWVTSGTGSYYFSISPTPDAASGCTQLWYSGDITVHDNDFYTANLQDQIQAAVSQFRATSSGLDQATVPGAAAAVVRGNHPPVLVASGIANMETGREMFENDLFHAGSITKTFTAAWIMQLDQEGMLSIDDVISDYLTFPNGDKITLRQLLSHTSGITSFTSMQEFSEWYEENPYPTSYEVLEFMKKHPYQSFNPGDDYEYSNSNYYLLGLIGELVTGNTWHVEIRNRFLDPYQLSSTYIYGLEQGPVSQVQGYAACPEPYCEPAGFMTAGDDSAYRLGWAAGGIVSSPKDLAKWMEVLVDGPVVDENRRREMQTVTPQSVEAMKKTGEYFKFNKGVGLCLFQFYTSEAGFGWGHEGQIGGFGNVAAYFLDMKTSLALSANEVSSDVNKGLYILVDALVPGILGRLVSSAN